MSYWHQVAQRVFTIEEQRYCYLRALEENEEDFEARARLVALGNGPMRAPAQLGRDVIIMPAGDARPQRELFSESEPDSNASLAGLIIAIVAAAAVVLIIVLALHL